MSCFEHSFFFPCPRGRGDFFWQKVANWRSGHHHFVEIFFQKNDLKKKMVFYIRKTNAIIWYNHLLYQKSKEKSILEKVVFFPSMLPFSRTAFIYLFFTRRYFEASTNVKKTKKKSWSNIKKLNIFLIEKEGWCVFILPYSWGLSWSPPHNCGGGGQLNPHEYGKFVLKIIHEIKWEFVFIRELFGPYFGIWTIFSWILNEKIKSFD